MDTVRERVYSDHDVDKENRSFKIENLIVISLHFQGSAMTDETTDRIIFVFSARKTHRRSSRGQVGSFEHLYSIAGTELGPAGGSLGPGVVAGGPRLRSRSGPGS